MNSLTYPERAEIAWAMTDVLRGIRLRLQMTKGLWLLRNQKWLDAVALVHKFVDKHIGKAYEEMRDLSKSKVVEAQGSSTEAETERSDLLWSMVNNLKDDKEALRSQILLLFVPNNDTTSIFVSNVVWNKYLDAVLNESK